MISITKAIRIIQSEKVSPSSETAELANVIGRVLAENIIADTDLPPFDRSQMDGFAVNAKDTFKAPVELKIVGESAAGSGWHKTLKKGEAVRIMTGAPVPIGADAIQKVELTEEKNSVVTVFEATDKGHYIIRRGAEIKKGQTVLHYGEQITPANIAVPAAFGYAKVKVAKRPRIAIFSTGSEIVNIGKNPKRDQIRNSNSIMLKSLSEQSGAIATVLPNVGDKLSDLKSQILSATKTADILITTGGVSVGKYDFTKTALTELGAEIFFDKIALKPGKPTVFAKLGKTFIYGLPGNPVSAAVTFHLLVRELIMLMQSATESGLRQGFAVMGQGAKSTKDRDTYLPTRLETDKTGRLIADPLKWHGSSDFIGFAKAEALIILPKGKSLEKDEVARIVHL